MVGGIRWPDFAPPLFEPPTDIPLYRVVEDSPHWGPLDANPMSKARFALLGTHAMFYVSDSPAGALWEALLRHTRFGARGVCQVPVAKLKGQSLVQVRLVRDNVKVLRLSRPELLHLFPDGDGPEVEAISHLIATPDHTLTHPVARALLERLQGLTPPIPHMPMLSWKSRQFPDATVFLAYEPQVDATYWQLDGDPTPLDTPRGRLLLREALARHGFHWSPADTIPPLSGDDPE